MAPFTTVFRASEPRRVKRNRQTVSCTACQRRKSRCDRRQPCGACEKRGDERTCQFAPASSVAGSSAGSRQEVQSRLHKLEEMVRRLAEGSKAGPAGAPSFGSRLESATGGNDMDLDTAENDRQGNDVDDEPSYHGPTSWAALVESIHDIQSALDAEGDEPPNSQPSEPDPDVVFGELPPVTTDDIERALPTRQDADRLVSAYFNAKYVAYPFIHTHHFRRRYETFWQSPSSAGFLWISTLFSILGVGALICLSKDKNSTAEPGPFLNVAARCLIAGRYLEGKTWSVEALTMLIHARSVQKTDADPTVWSLYALAVRLAQRQGYHRRWDQVSPKLTPFDAEMRRRVWLVLQCYDMVLSHQHGMPPMIHEDTFDAEPPTNATDEDFDEDSVIITSRPPTDPFPITAYIAKSKILPIVRRGMVFPLGTKAGGWAEIQETARDLEAWYASIPPCLRYRPIREASFTDPNYTVMHRAMLEITHYMAVCSLYRPYLTLALRQGSASEYAPALEHCRRAALRLIEIHFEMDQATQPGGRFHEEKYLVSSLALHDFLVAAMILCIELMESRDMRYSALCPPSSFVY